MASVSSGFVATEDGLQLYYRLVGDQGPLMVCCNGIGVSTFFWKYLAEHFCRNYRVLMWDYRGHGRSMPPADTRTADLSMTRNAQDLQCVLDAVAPGENAIFMGHSMGCQVILEYYQHDPSRFLALVPMLGTYGRALDTFFDSRHSKRVIDVVAELAAKSSRSRQRLLLPLYASPIAFAFARYTGLVDKYYANSRDIQRYTEHLLEVDPNLFLRMAQNMGEHDLEDRLAFVGVPTLVFGAENDLFTPLHRSTRMAELIPEAELTVLADGSHAAIVEHPETIILRLERFLRERVHAVT